MGLSDHCLLRWKVDIARDAPSAVTVCSRPWRRLDVELFRSELIASRLCRPEEWPTGVDDMAALYTDEIDRLLDRVLPKREFVRRQRPSDPWFDSECRAAKRITRAVGSSDCTPRPVVVRQLSRHRRPLRAPTPSPSLAKLLLPRLRGTLCDECIVNCVIASVLTFGPVR